MEPTTPPTPVPVRGRVIATILSGAALILLIFVAQILVTLEREVTHLREELATKQDLANLAVHIGPPNPAMAKLEGTCTDCHTKIFKMKKGTSGDMTMAKMKAGEQCGVCHDGKKQVGSKVVFATDDKANCEKCHKK